MIKYNSDQNFVVQDWRLLEELIPKLGCPRSESKFISTILQKTLNIFDFSFELKLYIRLKENSR
jgi:hypothetical protein